MSTGERVRRARELHRWTQATLVERVPELTQPRLSRAEANKADLDDTTSAAVAAATGVDASWLDRPARSFLTEISPHFRARSRTTENTKAAGRAWAELVSEAYDDLLANAQAIPAGLPNLQDVPARSAARELRRQLGFGSIEPLPYLLLATERLGVRVLGLPWASETVDAFCAWNGDEPTMALSTNVPGDRLRWTVAHELAHLSLHRDGRQGREVEAEADTFAAELLTPIDALRLEMPHHPTLRALTMLKSRWGVSVKSLIRRARELGSVDDQRATSLFRQVSARGWNRAEPGYVPREKPRAFRKLVEINFGDAPVTKFAREVGWSTELAALVLAEHATSEELPFESSTKFEIGNVVQLRRVD